MGILNVKKLTFNLCQVGCGINGTNQIIYFGITIYRLFITCLVDVYLSFVQYEVIGVRVKLSVISNVWLLGAHCMFCIMLLFCKYFRLVESK